MSTRERFSMWNQLYWVAISYLRRDTLWVYMGVYVLLFVMAWSGSVIFFHDRGRVAAIPEAPIAWTYDFRLLPEASPGQALDYSPLLKDILEGRLPSDVEGLEFSDSLSGKFTKEHFRALQQYPNLRGLKFSTTMNDSQFLSDLEAVKQLEFLEINDATLHAAEIRAIASLPRLIYLRLTDCVYPDSLNELEHAPQLHTLIIDDTGYERSQRNAPIESRFSIPVLPHVERLAVQGTSSVTHKGPRRTWPNREDIDDLQRLPQLRQLFIFNDDYLALPVDDIQKSLPEVLVFPCLITQWRGAFALSMFMHMILLAILWQQLHAQTVTTIGPVVPRYWLPHQIVFVAIVLLTSLQQVLQLMSIEFDPLASAAFCSIYYFGWGIVTYCRTRFTAAFFRLPNWTIGPNFNLANLMMSVAILGAFAAALYIGRIYVDGIDIDIFLAGYYPVVSILLLVAGIAGLVFIVLRMPLNHLAFYKESNRLPPIEYTASEWSAWKAQVWQSKEQRNKADRSFSYLTPGCVSHDEWRRAMLVRNANETSGLKLLLYAVYIFVFMGTWIFIQNFVMDGIFAMRNTDILSHFFWNMLWLMSVNSALMLYTQWDQRRRVIGLELMRPVTRTSAFRDISRAIISDSFLIYVLQTIIIIAYGIFSANSIRLSFSAVALLLVTWCLIPTTIMILITITKNWIAFLYNIFAGVCIVAAELALLASQRKTQDTDPSVLLLELFLAVIAAGVLYLFICVARYRWDNLEFEA